MNKEELYPIKFNPIFKYRLWGGNKLKTNLNKDYLGENIGESWEISDVKGDETLVSNGNLKGQTLKDLITTYKVDFVGKKVYEEFGTDFPILIKFIDAEAPLSIQVHPSNELAKERHNSFGKNEMWYVMGADKDAELIVGFNSEMNQDNYKKHLNDNTILEVLHHEKVSKGDAFYIPTGRVHAIGAGVLLAEIQQTSDVTYRIYDYKRKDKVTGKERELHTELAVDAIDFKRYNNYKSDYEKAINTSNVLVHSPYFKTNFINISGTLIKDYSNLDSFVIYMCVSGSLELLHNKQSYHLNIGETILLPAKISTVELFSESSEILEIFF
ncbi:class I mannose-6-phosphate isomerase [Winogradskyella litoriviva]|uniref:Phosphohexomutase n=1 Tax=Winogradskyella litoriviva TaxID=1220182 RepID=A0ABX2E414_9FLAO|nr:type I phosphomannose isomerase catalytic subunit [Winogradskyella litoriviva]NRD23019.1 class I mannose-6-phosphate isomerase [Winogradskyella litoriviva]